MNESKSKSTPAGVLLLFERRRRDSNPRAVAGKLISSLLAFGHLLIFTGFFRQSDTRQNPHKIRLFRVSLHPSSVFPKSVRIESKIAFWRELRAFWRELRREQMQIKT